MAWVVDTCLLIDVAENDSEFGESSADLLDLKRSQGLVLCPVSYAELAPVFNGDVDLQDEFLRNVGVNWTEPWLWQDTKTAHQAWTDYIQKKRSGKTPKRPIADVLIGSFSVRFQGLLTRNPKDFASIFPHLKLLTKI